ncbi:MAG: helix-turn-helix domain-containing protein [Trueperaceae bacterium]
MNTGYGQFCPVSRALDVLGDRWTLLIVRDLLHDVHHFNELARGLPRLSRGLLAKRLRHLEGHGIVRRSGSGTRVSYQATEAGQELRPLIHELVRWGARWVLGPPTAEELDPVLLMWWMRRRVTRDRLPDARQVAQFDFEEAIDRSFWLVMERSDVSVCFDPPPFDVDLFVEGSLVALFEVWTGSVGFEDVMADGRLRVRALPWQERDFPTWFARSPGAALVAEARADLGAAALHHRSG